MRTFITVKNIRKSDETAKIGSAVNALDYPVTAKIIVFSGRLYYRLIDVYGAVNPNFATYNSNFNPAIHAEIRASKHATGTVICTNYGVYVDIVALKHMLKDHFVDRTSGRNGRVHEVGDGVALDTLLQQPDSTGTGFDDAVGKLPAEALQEIDPSRLFYSRNIPTEKQYTPRGRKNNSSKEPTDNKDQVTAVSDTPKACPPEPVEATDDKSSEACAESPILEAGLKQLAALGDIRPDTCSAVARLIDKLCDGKKLTITLSVSLD